MFYSFLSVTFLSEAFIKFEFKTTAFLKLSATYLKLSRNIKISKITFSQILNKEVGSLESNNSFVIITE